MSKIYCSKCGCSQELSIFEWSVNDFIEAGWRSYGNLFYCPFCSKWCKKLNKPKTTSCKLATKAIMGDYIF